MHTDWAVIEINGEWQVVHRRPAPANFVLPWDFAARAAGSALKKESGD